MSGTARIGVDVGGTFTDFVLHDPARNLVATGKRLTTPDDPSEAIVAGIARLLDETGLAPGALHSVVHGTTLVTNTIIERTGCKVGLLTTEGFRDSIEIGKETRYDLYDLFLEPAPTLVPRALRLEVPGRLDVHGAELKPLDEAAVRRQADALVGQGVEAIAIGFMHAWRDPRHERRAAEIVRAAHPGIAITLSSAVAPEIREFERISTACANAYVQPRMLRYLGRLEARLAELGVTGALYVMLSGGGIASVQEAKDFPIRLIESGPAAGAMAASWLARQAGLDHVVSYDMGGTTAKMCLIENGAPDRKFEFEAGRVRRFQKGSGLPLKVSVVDMIEIGAGGGSIARVEEGSGLMKVGPRSAGAKPGPICYGRGGTEPTVTDSDLVLGRLDPAYFLGGEMALDLDAVKRAVTDRLAAALHVTPDDSALGIRRIVDETMAAATRMHLAEKGRDPRRYTLIAFGGAGPVHACDLARLLKMRRVVVPLGAGVASALGFLVAPPATDLVRSLVGRLERLDWAKVASLYAGMAEEARALLTGAGADPAAIVFRPAADMRYVGQGFEIPVPLPGMSPTAADIGAIREAFLAAYRERFGRALEDLPVEALTWRLAAAAPGRDIDLKGANLTEGRHAARGRRRALFEGHGWQDCDVYDRYALAPGDAFAGPALVEERESTCVVPPGAQVRVDAFRNLVIELPPPQGGFTMTRLHRRALLGATLALPALHSAGAQSWPTRPVIMVNPWPPGGSSDTMARLFAQRFTQMFGQSVVVENRAGASGTIGHNHVAQQRPDGYTLLFATNSTYAIAPHLIAPLPYDNRAAFTGISLVARTAQALCVHPSVPVNTIQEFLAYVRARPGQVTFSSAGIGATSHLATELLMAAADLAMMHVPYRGGAPSAQAVLSGETRMSFIDAITALPHRRAGTLKMLAVSTATRSPLAEDVPTLQEAGVAGFESSTDMALLAPAGLSAPIVAFLSEAVREAVNDPPFRQQIIAQGAAPVGSTPAEFDAYWTAEPDKWGKLIRARGITIPR